MKPRPPRILFSTALLAAVVAAACFSCAPAPAGRTGGPASLLVVTQTPLSSGMPVSDRLSPDARYPAGSRIVAVSLGAVNADGPTVLSGDLEAAGSPAVSADAERVAFAGRRGAGDRWAIYEVRVRRPQPRKLAELDGNCVDPAYLAGDRLVASCTDETSRWSLRIFDREGSTVERITFGEGSAFDPTPLQDGRILFSMWQAPGPGRPDGGSALFTVNPDGTLLEPFRGSHGASAPVFRPRQDGDGVIFLAEEDASHARSVRRVEMSRPRGTATHRTFGTSPDGGEALDVATAEPLPGGGLLVSGRPHATTASLAIYRTEAGASSAAPVFDDPESHDLEAVPLAPRPVPRGRPSGVDRNKEFATLVCYDAARSDLVHGPPADAPQPSAMLLEALPAAAPDGEPLGLGTLPVESDGSLLLEVPADTPLRLVSLDGEGRRISASSWFWLRPGEVRACFGCHEDRDSAPVNRRIAALSSPPWRRQPGGEWER